jgi:hypothetical protein
MRVLTCCDIDSLHRRPALLFRRLAGTIAAIVLLPYLAVPSHDFPPAQPFAGSQWLNPYANLRGPWRRAHFHAHGRVWGGVTAGAQEDADVITAYRMAGYDIAGVSNYQSISPLDLVPVYEHGFNVGKHHQLAIGARGVTWWDFPFWQGIDEKQYVLDRLRPLTDLIALSHPSRLRGYTSEDVRQLTGYELMEIANGHITTEDRWDAALSSGHAIWGLGNDDTHDVTDVRRFAVAWTMIAAALLTPADVIAALRQGQSYVVVRQVDAPVGVDVTVPTVRVDGSRMTVTVDGPAATITFIGQDGRTRSTAVGTAASYELRSEDTYIRVNVHGSTTDLFLNPVMRTAIATPPRPEMRTNRWWTWSRRGILVMACVALAALSWSRVR